MTSAADQLIDSLRKEFENPTEWRRRQAFIKLNFNQLPFERLVCLSHCFVNSSLHGAVYPERVMDEVEQYSRTIDIYLSSNEGRGDSSSSSAGNSHAKLQKRTATQPPQQGADEPSWKRPRQGEPSVDTAKRPRPLDLDSQLQSKESGPTIANRIDGVNLAGVNLTDFYLREIETDESGTANPANANPANVLKCSTDFCRRTLEYRFDPAGKSMRCTILLDNAPVSVLTADTQAAAKAGAGAGLLAALRQRCWTLIVRSDKAFFSAQADAGVARPTVETAAAADEGKIGSDNVGHRLLKGMGWSGSGGLGKQLNGRTDPVANDVRIVSRAGLGADVETVGSAEAIKTSPAFQSAINRILKDFQHDPEDRDDLFFASDFVNVERRYVHAQCLKLGLASRSYSGDEKARCLVVSRKRSASELVDFVRRNGGSTVRYRLVPPGGQRGAGELQADDS